MEVATMCRTFMHLMAVAKREAGVVVPEGPAADPRRAFCRHPNNTADGRCRRSTVGVPELSKGVGVARRLRRGSEGAGCSRELPKLGQTDSSGVPDLLWRASLAVASRSSCSHSSWRK